MSTQYPLARSEAVPKKSQGVAAYVLAGISFIPLIGVVFGIAAIVVGAVRKQRIAIFVGISGIVCTIVLYGALFYFGFAQRGGVYDGLRNQMAVTMLNSAVREIEYFRQVNGRYPRDLKEVEAQVKNGMPVLFDPTAMERKRANTSYFYYSLEADGKNYYLRSVGRDGIPFTPDDIVPNIPPAQRAKLGLLIEKKP